MPSGKVNLVSFCKPQITDIDSGGKALPEKFNCCSPLSEPTLAIKSGDTSENKEFGDFYDSALILGASAQESAKYLVGNTMGYLNETKLALSQCKLTPEALAVLTKAEKAGEIGTTTAKQLLPELLEKGGDVALIIKERNLAQISDPAVIKGWISDVFARSEAQLNDYKNGKVKLRQYFVGELMKLAKGKANPQVMNQLLDEMLPNPE